MLHSQPCLNWVQGSSTLPNCHRAINWVHFTLMGMVTANEQYIAPVASFHISSASATHLHMGHQQTGALSISYSKVIGNEAWVSWMQM